MDRLCKAPFCRSPRYLSILAATLTGLPYQTIGSSPLITAASLLHTRADTIETIAERIRKQVEIETDITISIGISHFRSGLELKELIKEADSALYKAKELGRNRIVFSGFEENKS